MREKLSKGFDALIDVAGILVFFLFLPVFLLLMLHPEWRREWND